MKPKLIAAALGAVALAACATPTVYQPSPGARGVGFEEYRIEPGRYRITFRGGGGAPEAMVADYALLRAAEVAVRDGYDWFLVTDRSTMVSDGGGTRVGLGTGGASFGRRSAVGIGIGTSFDLSGGPAFTRSIEVMMGRGPAPREPDAYDARQVMETVGSRARG